MAYSFNDPYRPVRIVLRLDAVVVGMGLGLLLLIYPTELLTSWGFDATGPAWSARIGGSSLLGLGVGLLLAASERELRVAPLIAAVLSNGLIALSLLSAYLQQELDHLTSMGYLLLVVVFGLCLLTVVMPIPYFRSNRRPPSI